MVVNINSTMDSLHSLPQLHFNGVALEQETLAVRCGANKLELEHNCIQHGKQLAETINTIAFTKNYILTQVQPRLLHLWVQLHLDWDLVRSLIRIMNLAFIHGLSIQLRLH